MTTKTRPTKNGTATMPTPMKAMPMRGTLDLAAVAAEDMGNLVFLEHVNVTIPDYEIANIFYILGLGFTRDPHFIVGPDNMWVNIGTTQFHLPAASPQVLRGVVTIVVPELDELAARLKSIEPHLKGTQFSWLRHKDSLTATCPWGNKIRCILPAPEYGNMRLGIAYVQFDVPLGAAAGIARFYDQVLSSPATIERDHGITQTKVRIGANQTLLFKETRSALPAYDGHHIAVYVNTMSHAFEWLKARGAIMEGLAGHQFRFKDILDPESGKLVYQLEHEVRSMKHPLFLRPLVNRDPTMTMQGYSR